MLVNQGLSSFKTAFLFPRHDGEYLAKYIDDVVKKYQQKNKSGPECRLAVYERWAIHLLRSKIGFLGSQRPQYGWPQSFLNYIRALEPRDVVGEDHKATYQMTFGELCQCLVVPWKE